MKHDEAMEQLTTAVVKAFDPLEQFAVAAVKAQQFAATMANVTRKQAVQRRGPEPRRQGVHPDGTPLTRTEKQQIGARYEMAMRAMNHEHVKADYYAGKIKGEDLPGLLNTPRGLGLYALAVFDLD